MSDRLHTIQFAARHSGLSMHTIRAWERRYGALAPDRTATNRRLYSAEDIEKLSLLHDAVQSGHRISQVAALSPAELRNLLGLREVAHLPEWDSRTVEVMEPPVALSLAECARAVAEMDNDAL